MRIIVAYSFALGCILFVLSLPFARTSIGGHLRRGAAALVVVALAPSVFLGFARQVTGTGGPGAQPSFVWTLGCMVVIVVACLAAYGILELRARLRRPKNDAWTEYINLRSSGKTVLKDRERERITPHLSPHDTLDEGP